MTGLLDSYWDELCEKPLVWTGQNFSEIDLFCKRIKYFCFYGVDKESICFKSGKHIWLENIFTQEQIKASVGDAIKFDWRNKKFLIIAKHSKA